MNFWQNTLRNIIIHQRYNRKNENFDIMRYVPAWLYFPINQQLL